MQLNEIKFLENVQRIHLKPEELPIYTRIADSDVRVKLNEFIKYGRNSRFSIVNPRFSVVNMRFSAALDEICANIVGRTMFKVLMTKMQSKRKSMRIERYRGNGSAYDYDKYVVYINLSFYGENGIGIPSRKYFYINEEGNIKTKLKSLAGSMFHEFCHGLHDISGTKKSRNILCFDGSNIKPAWSNDEELRTICCVRDAVCGLMDPICDHCFDMVQSILKNEQFLPRYSHGGYEGEREPSTYDLQEFNNAIPASRGFMDGWREYEINLF